MEDILENNGFRFKETIMAGDPMGDTRELRKVLGLRWDTERGKICVDIKLNYGEKVKGVYTEEDMPLTDPESTLPSHIMRRILWRVAQSLYHPLGLWSIYIVKWKLLMWKVMLKGKNRDLESILEYEQEAEFQGFLWDMDELRKIKFPRCVSPLEGQFRKPLLLVFRDGFGRHAACWYT
jgi:hypothetical protein